MGWRPGCRSSFGNGYGSGGKLKAALLWWLDHGDEWKAAKEKADAEGSDIPDQFDPPELLEGFGGWYADFWKLSTERQVGFGVGPIPQSAIDRHVAGWFYEDADTFEFCIRAMDGAYLMKANGSDDDAPPVSPMEAFRGATSHRRGK